MIIQATKSNIEWLTSRLYEESRNLMALGMTEPVFVLFTTGADERDAVEALIWKHLQSLYGDEMFKKLEPEARFKTSTSFVLPPFGSRVILMDVKGGD